MIEYIVVSIVSFLISFFSIPRVKKIFEKYWIVGIDQHKKDKRIIASSGGIVVSLSFTFSLLIFVGIKSFVLGSIENALVIFSTMVSILIATLIGFIDDVLTSRKSIITKAKEKDIRLGLPQWLKPLLTLPAALPLMVLNIGDPTVNLPFFGNVNFGIFYPVLIVPLVFVFSSNVVNMLAGFNGMEAGMAIVYLSFLSYVAFISNSIAFPIFFISLFSLIPFFIYNFYPAKILPGDSLTYFLGSIIVVGAVAGNIEKAAVFVFLPFLIEFFLKLRSKFKASSLGILKNNYLKSRYKKIYSLTHLIMKIGKFNEKQITIIFIFIETFSVLLYFIFK
ncbi:MAG: hypothetical protein RMJ17_03575 [Candidatus Aenigmarchaeota archaeon]|nr:hypothetical protein [Candidatus Aenigmarchaeota archaeon]MDW8149644.1 hypothetical protein [Candidatus Aenigmarchaeota archaeon]